MGYSFLTEEERGKADARRAEEKPRGLFERLLFSSEKEKLEDARMLDEAADHSEKALLKHQQGVKNRARTRDSRLMAEFGVSSLGLNDGFEFEGETGDAAESLRKQYLSGDSDAAWVQPDSSLIDPEEEPRTAIDVIRDTTNFLFSDEMGLLGMKWDDEAFEFSSKNFIHQITEHPYATGLTLASYIIPMGMAWQKGVKVASRAATLAAVRGDAGAAAGKGLLGTQLRHRFDDHSRLVQTLAKSDENGEAFRFGDTMLKKIKEAKNPDEIAQIVSPKDLRKHLMADWSDARYMELEYMAKTKAPMTKAQRAEWFARDKFQNTYFHAMKDTSKDTIKGMDSLFTEMGVGKLLAGIPDFSGAGGAAKSQAFFRYLQAGSGRSKEKLAKEVGEEAAEWSEGLANTWTDLFKQQYDEGLITEETWLKFTDPDQIGSGLHLPAVYKGTPGFADVTGKTAELLVEGDKVRTVTSHDVRKLLAGPTMKQREEMVTDEKTLDAIKDLITDPEQLTIGGYVTDLTTLQLHRNFRDILVDVGEKGQASRWTEHVMDPELLVDMPKFQRKRWYSFEELSHASPGLAKRMKRMIDKKVDKDGLLPENHANMPAVSKTLVDEFFGNQEGSAVTAAGYLGKVLELWTAVHKTARTAGNAPTHATNSVGNMMFLGMAGVNPIGAQTIADGKVFAHTFMKIAKKATGSRKAQRKAREWGEEIGKRDFDSFFNVEELSEVLGKDRYITDKFGEKIDLAEMLANPKIVELFEAQAFTNVEAFGRMKRILDEAAKIPKMKGETGTAKGLFRLAAAIVAGPLKIKKIEDSLEFTSSLYMAEDVIPKMQLMANMARKGWGVDAIVEEVGRRLPQYNTIGNLPKQARNFHLPWITFPAECARIMKNNMQDLPVSTSVWLQSPAMVQSFVSGTGMGPTYADYEETKKTAPGWAQRYQTIMLNNKADTALNVGGGAAVGGAVGGFAGGVPGALGGAALGATAGAAAGWLFGGDSDDVAEEMQEYNRAWTMDFLPFSSLMPATTSEDTFAKLNPFTSGNYTGGAVAGAALDVSPMEPYSVIRPLLNVVTGKGDFGEEIKSTGFSQSVGKASLGFLGFLAPPIVQKNGMKLAGPGGNPIEMAQIFESNAGQMTLPKAITAGFFGLAAAGTTFMGGKAVGMGKVGTQAARVAGGLLGAAAGSEVNMRRFMTDIGVMPDPRTGEYGNASLDFFANSFFGLNKSWKATPAQRIYGETMRAKEVGEQRTVMIKEYRDAILSGHSSKAKAWTGAIYKSFVYEHGDTKVAKQKFNEWKERQLLETMKLPIDSGLSDEMLEIKVDALRAMNGELDKSRREQLAYMRALQQQRALMKAKSTRIVY